VNFLHGSFYALALIAAGTALAQGYPAGPVRVIVPFPPGGGVDGMCRILSQKLTESLGRPLPVENRSGANGNIGTEVAAKAPRDGYTLLFTGAGLVTNPSLYDKVPYDPVKDFEPISLVSIAPNVLVVHPSVPAKSVKELIALARARPKQVLFAGSGSGSRPWWASCRGKPPSCSCRPPMPCSSSRMGACGHSRLPRWSAFRPCRICRRSRNRA
jgi:tripartite-type tricarboxylate transporter receptor subunit TctC